MRHVLTSLGLALATALPLLADPHPNLARGLGAQAVQAGDIDHVNSFNGNLVLTIPVGGTYKASDHLSYGLTLNFNSNPWNFIGDDIGGTTYQLAYPDPTA